MDRNRAKQIADALARRSVGPCPRCNNFHLTIVGETNLTIDGKGLLNLGTHLPAAVVACANCGYLMMHAINALGLQQQP